MMGAAFAAGLLVLTSTGSAGLPPLPSPPDPPRPRPEVLPDAADEGARDLDKTAPVLRRFVVAQPYGKSWRELVRQEAASRPRGELGEAATHPDLKHDPMEVQQQAQYLEPTRTEVRYGFASLRGVRVFHYGKLRAVQLVIEPVGRSAPDRFKADVEALSEALSDPRAALRLDQSFRVRRNDLVDQRKKKPEAFPVPPLRIELEPGARPGAGAGAGPDAGAGSGAGAGPGR